jgi:hypothetical protein
VAQRGGQDSVWEQGVIWVVKFVVFYIKEYVNSDQLFKNRLESSDKYLNIASLAEFDL